MNNLPLIAITTGGKDNFPHMPDLYIKAADLAGAAAVFIGPDERISDIVVRYAGFIIPGGRDIDPLLYNEERITDINPEEEKRVEFELSLFHSAVKQRKPILGICYGMQLLNVAMGGALYQDIGIQKSMAIYHKEGTHTVQVADNPFIEEGRYAVNSSHHQAVKEMGRDLLPFSFAPDGIIEACYSQKHSFLLGVQWHPERMINWISRTVFASFVEACLERN